MKRLWGYEFHFDWVIAVILVVAILYLGWGIFGNHVGIGDEGAHMRSAAEVVNGNLVYLGAMYKPAYMAELSMSYLIFRSDFAGLFVSLFYAVLSVYFVYLIGVKLYSKEAGWVAAIFLSLSELFVFYSKVVRPETMITFLFVLAFWFYLYTDKKSLILLGVTAGIAFWVRSTAVFIIAIFILAELIKDWKSYKNIGIVVGIFALFTVVYYVPYSLFAPEFQSYAEHVVKPDLLSGMNFSYYGIILWDHLSPIALFAVGFGLVLFLYDRKNWLVWLWVVVLFVGLSIYPQHRYKLFLPIFPALALMLAYVYEKTRKWKIASIGYTVLIGLSLAASSYAIADYSPDGHYLAANFVLRQGADKAITTDGIIFFYHLKYSGENSIDRTDILELRSISTVAELEEKYQEGYDYVILDNRMWEETWQKDIGEKEDLAAFLMDFEPAYITENEAWERNLEVQGTYRLYPYMTELDKKRALDVKYVDREDKAYKYIYVFRLSDVFNE